MAERYGLSSTQISSIIQNQSWIDPEYTPPGHYFIVSELDWGSVRRIRQQYDEGGTTQAKLAESYGVARSTISYIVQNKTWFDPDYEPPSR